MMKIASYVCYADSIAMKGATVSSPAAYETNRFNVLRLRYKAAFDTCKAIAIRNAKVLSSGGTMSKNVRRNCARPRSFNAPATR
jgi:hypothetical protein